MSDIRNISNESAYPKALHLLKRFSSTEMRDFYRFVKSEYYNTDEKIISLTAYLKDKFFSIENRLYSESTERKIYNSFCDSDKKTKESLSEKQKVELNSKLSDLTKLGLQFLTVQALENSSEQANLCYKVIVEKELSRFFNPTKEREKLNKEAKRDIDFYLKKYYIEYHDLHYHTKYKVHELIKKDNIPDVLQYYDIQYLINRIRLQISAISIADRTQRDYDFEPIQFIMELSMLPQYQCPLLVVYRTALEILQNQHNVEGGENFDQLKKLMDIHGDELMQESKMELYTVLTNFCISKVKKKDLTYSQRAFELFEDLERKNLLSLSNTIPISKLNAVITASCHAAKFEWAESILEKYWERIHKEEQNNVYKFNLGQIAFYQKQYKEADNFFSVLEQITGKHQAYSINCRILYLKCLYELENSINYVESKCRSAKEFLRTHKHISDVDRDAQTNFITTLFNLYRIKKGDKGSEKLKDIEKKLQSKKDFEYISDVRWLLEKIVELKQQKKS